MKEIQMKNGYVALIDDEDYEASLAHSWYGSVYRGGSHVYAATNLRGGGRLYLHHLVMGKPEKGYVVDHINGDSLDNRRCNLRFATYSENVKNNHSRVLSKAGYRGVQIQGGRYVARVAREGVRTYLGVYPTAEQAAAAIAAFEAAVPPSEETIPTLVARIAELEAELASIKRAA